MRKIYFLVMLMCLSGWMKLDAQASHDPSHIAKDNGRYWVFSTGDGIAAMSSGFTSFATFRYESPVFKSGTWPSWINTYVPGFAGFFWAPDLIYMNNKWHLYYSCSTFGSMVSAIGLATTTSLNSGTWTDQGMVTFTDGTQNINAIDPSIMRDKSGKIWLTYGSYWNGIVATELDSTNGKPFNRTNLKYLANNGCEASSLISHGNYYYLFFNRGSCCNGVNSTYQMYVGRSTSPTGPFLDKNGNNCNAGGGTSFLHSDGRFIGPGHFGIMDSLISYHFYDGNDNGNSKLKVAKISWTNDWPVAVYGSQGYIVNGTYAIINRNSGKSLELTNETYVNGVNAIQSTENGNNSEKWVFTYTAEKYYQIKPLKSADKSLEIANCSTAGGEKARIWTTLGSACQEWYISLTSGGYYRIFNKNSDQALEIVNAYTTDGAAAQQWPWNQNNTQQWKFKAPLTTDLEATNTGNGKFYFYPNPCKDILHIHLNTESIDGQLISIYTMLGTPVVKFELSEGDTDFSLSNTLKSGLYLICLTDKNGNLLETKTISLE